MSNPFGSLEKYIPSGSLALLEPLLLKYPLQLRISKPRKTKFGDYRLPRQKEAHKISVNGNLNPYAFLITLLHEYAHLVAYADFGRKIKPHGPEWQNTFRQVCEPFFEASIFPNDVKDALKNSLAAGHASSATSQALLLVLRNYNPDFQNQIVVQDLPEGATFNLSGKALVKGPKSRKRYRCKSIKGPQEYMVHPLAEVEILD